MNFREKSDEPAVNSFVLSKLMTFVANGRTECRSSRVWKPSTVNRPEYSTGGFHSHLSQSSDFKDSVPQEPYNGYGLIDLAR